MLLITIAVSQRIHQVVGLINLLNANVMAGGKVILL